MKDFKQLRVWQKSFALTLSLYQVTKNFPHHELYGLVSQIRRAASSMVANIAEGCGRGTQAELARFLRIALGSASELQCHLLLACELGFLNTNTHSLLEKQVIEIRTMLIALIQKIDRKQ